MKVAAAALGALLLAASVQAQTPAQLPSGGQLLKELSLPPPPAPAITPNVAIEQADKGQVTDTTPIAVAHVAITGSSVFSADALHALIADAEGKTLNLAKLEELADRITAHYRKHGYPLARAYLPAQTIEHGHIRIAVLEARYGKVTLNNQSSTADRALRATLAPLAAGAQVTEQALDRTLLLLSDVPGVAVNSTIRPGTATGTSDLEVDALSAPRYTGLLLVDDFGNPYTGRTRGSGEFDINSPFHQGDKFDLKLLTSGAGMTYGQAGYRYLLGSAGTSLGIAASYLHYQLSGALTELHAHGSAQIDTLDLQQPLIRSTGGNLYVQLQFDHKVMHDDIDLADIRNDRHINAGSIILAGDRRDDHGVTNFNVSASSGNLTFDDAAAALADRLAADTQGSSQHYEFTLARLQQIDAHDALYAAITGQRASSNLDPADQFYLGGPSNLRGYEVGALTGSDGYLASLEWRRALPIAVPGNWLATVFADRGHIQIYERNFQPGENGASLSDVGGGLRWDGPRQWSASLQAATHVGNSSPLLRSDSSVRFWAQLQKGF